jgi:hypothetical protein
MVRLPGRANRDGASHRRRLLPRSSSAISNWPRAAAPGYSRLPPGFRLSLSAGRPTDSDDDNGLPLPRLRPPAPGLACAAAWRGRLRSLRALAVAGPGCPWPPTRSPAAVRALPLAASGRPQYRGCATPGPGLGG